MTPLSPDHPLSPSPEPPLYAPLLETARLYAGWLMAWYGMVFLLGGQQAAGKLPLHISWLEGIYRSPLIVACAFATFLFLLLTDIHANLRGGPVLGFLLLMAWLALTTGFTLGT